ncbi:MAG: response regulator [Desulfamplus sp.]|nr:response regulator [Desulfamplus sp.]
MQILIAEDDRTSRIILSEILKRLGHDPVVTENGIDAWNIMQTSNAPQLAILDWQMPKLDGASLCKKLREEKRKEPLYLILLTSKTNTDDIVAGLEAGADDYITKPYNNAELRARVNVGCRMIALQNDMRDREKLQGVLEMSGAVCHELNQPLQVLLGYSDLLLMDIIESDPNYSILKEIKISIKKIGDLTNKIMRVTRYQSKPYLQGQIVDIEQASKH